MSIDLVPYSSEIEDIEPGETQRFNHTDCQAGTDARRRLYVSRPVSNPEIVIGYCHNCQQKGNLYDHGHTSYRNKRHTTKLQGPSTITDVVHPPPYMIRDLSLWTTEALSWAIKNKLRQDDIDLYNIRLDPSTGRVYLPRYSSVVCSTRNSGRLNGYQLRKVEENDGPKYLTARRTDDPGYTTVHTMPAGANHTIIVEDLVSAIHIAHALRGEPVRIVVNYGTKINLEALAEMQGMAMCSRWVWLDNDSPHVIAQAKLMGRTMDLLFGGKSVVIEGVSDPKHYGPQVIREAFDDGQH